MDATQITIPGYRIIQKIGAGGMSVVYLAEQQSLHREVALKVMRPVVADESHTIERFEHEAKTIAQLYHPNIMSIYDVGHMTDGTLFYAMPHLTHGDLSEIEWQGDQHIKTVFEAISDGLGFAHEHGVIHRDLKPENILFDSFGHPQIADFGIALSNQHKKWTKDNSIVGSLHYISPEQAQSQDVDARSDIYALGAMLYEVLTGQAVFQEQEELALMLAHVSQQPKDLPPKLQHWQTVISKCLAKSPKQRYQNAQQLKTAIAGVNSDHIATQSRPQIQPIKYGYVATAVLLFLLLWAFWPDQESTNETPLGDSQFVGTNNSTETSHDSHYIEINENDQSQALSQLSDRLKQPWEVAVAESLHNQVLLHIKTQPEVGVSVAEQYINKLSESGLNALNQSDFQNASAWQLQLKSAQNALLDFKLPELQQQVTSKSEQLDRAISDAYQNQKTNNESQQSMLEWWPDLNKNQPPKAKIADKEVNDFDLKSVPLPNKPNLLITDTEVTVGQFRSFANATALKPERCKNPTTSSLRFSSKTWSNPGFPQKNKHPVVCVSWQQATGYARWLSQKTGHTYRLPKANEWLSAKATSKTACGQHNVAGRETQHLKIKGNRHPCKDNHVQTAPVKAHLSDHGIYGMQGNAREWLQGCKKKNKIQSFFSNSNQCDSHPTIGQSWLSGQQDAGDVNYDKSGQAFAHIGFRLIREL